ncbi:hypothetical protein ACGFNU_33820 [Spirillospora sp. NPDC048911]|uniref:hypothetical protein n=1 Tax=Spirillospora sp. NPDC048911 TaxID=3364527 RepID=UPI0037117B4F
MTHRIEYLHAASGLARWLGWLAVAAVFGTLTPMAGFWSMTGPLNVGSGIIGVHTIAATWGIFVAATSAWMLHDLRNSQPRTSKAHGGDARPSEAS